MRATSCHEDPGAPPPFVSQVRFHALSLVVFVG